MYDRPPANPFNKASAGMILVSLACIGLWAWLCCHDNEELDRRLQIERRRRDDAETELQRGKDDLDQALEKIHELTQRVDELTGK